MIWALIGSPPSTAPLTYLQLASKLPFKLPWHRSLLATSLGLAEPREPVSVADLLERFDAEALPRDPWVLDPAVVWP